MREAEYVALRTVGTRGVGAKGEPVERSGRSKRC